MLRTQHLKKEALKVTEVLNRSHAPSWEITEVELNIENSLLDKLVKTWVKGKAPSHGLYLHPLGAIGGLVRGPIEEKLNQNK